MVMTGLVFVLLTFFYFGWIIRCCIHHRRSECPGWCGRLYFRLKQVSISKFHILYCAEFYYCFFFFNLVIDSVCDVLFFVSSVDRPRFRMQES